MHEEDFKNILLLNQRRGRNGVVSEFGTPNLVVYLFFPVVTWAMDWAIPATPQFWDKPRWITMDLDSLPWAPGAIGWVLATTFSATDLHRPWLDSNHINHSAMHLESMLNFIWLSLSGSSQCWQTLTWCKVHIPDGQEACRDEAGKVAPGWSYGKHWKAMSRLHRLDCKMCQESKCRGASCSWTCHSDRKRQAVFQEKLCSSWNLLFSCVFILDCYMCSWFNQRVGLFLDLWATARIGIRGGIAGPETSQMGIPGRSILVCTVPASTSLSWFWLWPILLRRKHRFAAQGVSNRSGLQTI